MVHVMCIQALSLAKDKGLLRLLLSLVDAQSTQQSSKAPEPRSSAPADSKSVASDTASKRRQVLDALGDALSRANKHEDAAMAYLAAGSMEQALKAYRCACVCVCVCVCVCGLHVIPTCAAYV